MTEPLYNPGQPYLLPVPGGFSPGRITHITGTFTINASSLVLKFQSGPYGDPNDEVGMCIYARLGEGIFGVNSFTRAGGWAQEEILYCQNLVRGQSFEITILCDPQNFKIASNGQHLGEYMHRVNPSALSHFNVASGPNDVNVHCIWIEDPTRGQPSIPQPYSQTPPSSAPLNYSSPQGHYPSEAHGFGPKSPSNGKNKGLMGMVSSAGAAVAGALGSSALLGKSKNASPHYGSGYPSGPQYGPPPQPGMNYGNQPQYGQYPGNQSQYGQYPANQPQYPGGYPGGQKSGGGGILNKAMAVGGGILGAKAMGKGLGGIGASKGLGGLGGLGGSKAMKYGVPLAGAGLGGYMLSKGIGKGFDFDGSFDCSDSD